jgi:hypothetical protein
MLGLPMHLWIQGSYIAIVDYLGKSISLDNDLWNRLDKRFTRVLRELDLKGGLQDKLEIDWGLGSSLKYWITISFHVGSLWVMKWVTCGGTTPQTKIGLQIRKYCLKIPRSGHFRGLCLQQGGGCCCFGRQVG